MALFADAPARDSYDVVIIGGAIMGASVAWHLSVDPGFRGRVLVVERDPTFETASTTLTNSCLRQQFSTAINIRISQFTAQVIRDFPAYVQDETAPEITLKSFGYLYLADSARGAAALRAAQALQNSLGVATRILTQDQIAEAWPFMAAGDIVCGAHNPVDEGYFDGAGMCDWWRRAARRNGVEFVAGKVTGIEIADGRVQAVTLADGTRIACGAAVNAAGPRAAQVAAMAGLELPVEPRRRYSFVFAAQDRPQGSLPLIIDPSGVHVREEGAYYLAGCPPDEDVAARTDDFAMDHGIWERKVWPLLAARVPAFEAAKVMQSWVGHYAYNTLDQNAVIGPAPGLENFHFVNGFSGHGLQQAPAMGRGVAELIAHGRYRGLDLSPLGYARIAAGRPLRELAVI